VSLFERDEPAAGTSAVAGGMLAPISEVEFETSELIDFACASLARFPEWVSDIEHTSGLSCGYDDAGTLWVALDRDELAELDHVAALLEDKGLSGLPRSADEVREREPHLSGRVRGGLEVPGDHQVDPRRLCRALAEGARRLGASLYSGRRVVRVEALAGGELAVSGVEREGKPFRHRARCVVVAAGAWSHAGLELPWAPVGLRPVKGQLVRVRGPRLLRRVVRTSEVYLVPRADGELLIGATMEEMGFDLQATAGAAMDLLRRGWEALPGIYDLELDEVSVGLRSAVDDHLPVVGATEVEGLYVAVGHFRHGILLSPATARYLARWVLTGQEPRELTPFAPRRLVGQNARGGRH
jgi:glycine oxidase